MALLASYLHLIAITIVIVVTAASKSKSHAASNSKAKKRHAPTNTSQYSDLCTSLDKASYPPIQPNDKKRHKILSTLINASGLQNLLLSESPRLRAACWILYDDPAKLSATTSSSKSKLLERYALAVLYHATQGPNWTLSNNWLSGADVGKWDGIMTSRPTVFSLQKRVTKLVLGFNNMNGILPRELSLLRELRELDLHGNDFQGVLPAKALSELKHLEILELQLNNILGRIPTEIGMLKSVKEINLYGNYVEGPIPRRVGGLDKLGESKKYVCVCFRLQRLSYLPTIPLISFCI